jgi:hypothetical protein
MAASWLVTIGVGAMRDLIFAILFVFANPGDLGCLLSENRSLRFCRLDELRRGFGRTGNGSDASSVVIGGELPEAAVKEEAKGSAGRSGYKPKC